MTEPVGRIIAVPIEDELRTAYLDYAMSVIVSRPCPTSAMVSSRCTVASCTR